jgi:hypothetical protein
MQITMPANVLYRGPINSNAAIKFVLILSFVQGMTLFLRHYNNVGFYILQTQTEGLKYW